MNRPVSAKELSRLLPPERPLGVTAYVWSQLNHTQRLALVDALDLGERINDLSLAADRLAAGMPVDPAWTRVQLLDLRDFLAAPDGD